MPSSETLRAQTTPEDGALFSEGLHDFILRPEAPIAFTEMVRQKGTIPISDIKAGTRISIPLEKTCTLVEDINLRFKPPALPIPGGATYARYCDYLAYAIIDKVEIMFTSNNLQTFTMDTEWSATQFYCDEKRANEDKLVGGNLSAAARNTYAANPYPLQVRIPTPWKDIKSHNLIISALASKPTINIYFKNPASFIESDGAKPAEIVFTNCSIRYEQIHTTGHTRLELTAIQNEPNGIAYLYDDTAQFDFDIPADYFKSTGNKFPAELRSIDGPIRKLRFIVRTVDQLDPTLNNTSPYDIDPKYIEGMESYIVSNNMELADANGEQQIDGVRDVQKFHHCRSDTLQVEKLWEEFPEAMNCASGNASFGNYTNPILNLSNPSLAGSHPALRVTVMYWRHNWLVHQRGVIQRVWR